MATILIIDDDPLICDTMTRLIRRTGHEPHCAHTLREGVELAIRRGFDVVFLDPPFRQNALPALLARCERIRAHGAVVMGIAPSAEAASIQ